MNNILDFTRTLARDAGAHLLTFYEQKLIISTKSSEFDLVTQADTAAERLILDRIYNTYPDHSILSEESGAAAGNAFRWVIDPLDGTTNFAQSIPHFSVSIALEHNGTLVVGVIHDPIRDELFFAERGGGAWLETATGRRQLQVAPITRLEESILATGFAYRRDEGEHYNLTEFARVARVIRGMRRMGSAALDMAYVAAGRFGGYWEYNLGPWDTAAGALLVTEAGGVVTRMDGSAWNIMDKELAAAHPDFLPILLRALMDDTGDR